MHTLPAGTRPFAALGVPPDLERALGALGITDPFPIQAATLPDALRGRDVIARGRTGTGKTIAFAVPAVARLAPGRAGRQPHRPRALVLVPTRELAAQVSATFEPLARAAGLSVATVHGGVAYGPQAAALSRGVDVLVACPGRLEDLLAQRDCRLDRVEVVVLDEADHLADLGFAPAVCRILDKAPAGSQRLLFSATIDGTVDTLVRRYLRDPVTHAVDPVAEPVPALEHHLLHVEPADKAAVVHALAAGRRRTLLFTRTKYAAKKLTAQLNRAGITALELHGNLSQAARARNLAAFAAGGTTVLVATDIAARGIHVDDVAIVVHVDPPAEHKAYLHRSGRTARAGAGGTVVTLATPEQRRDVAALARAAGIVQHPTAVAPHHPLLAEIRGPEAPRAPRPAAAPPASPAPPSPPAPRARPARNRPAGQHRRPARTTS